MTEVTPASITIVHSGVGGAYSTQRVSRGYSEEIRLRRGQGKAWLVEQAKAAQEVRKKQAADSSAAGIQKQSEG